MTICQIVVMPYKDIWRQLLTLIFHQTFNFKINMRQQCDFNEMYVNVNIQRINLWEFSFQKKRKSCVLMWKKWSKNQTLKVLDGVSSWCEKQESIMTFSLSAQWWEIGCIFVWWHTKIYHLDMMYLIQSGIKDVLWCC